MSHHQNSGFEVRECGAREYLITQSEMRSFTESRNENTIDQLWLLEHPPVYTQGVSCDERTLRASTIPVVKSDRGGHITYHGPGQLVIYSLIDLRRRGFGIRILVNVMEQAVIDYLGMFGVSATRQRGAPGVYVDGAKIAALGLRVRKGSSYHGLSLNVDMDLTPFDNINPCGYQGLQTTSVRALGIEQMMPEVKISVVSCLAKALTNASQRVHRE
ncbi:MAG: lipoyl(octanoyl) transferase LipB [Proteobacteria bacterium]|jgi:lipoyl(octanoyl) transferase|nr:lipoyl(octanoyl) transferase LipB [Pseudomonadota bacterium]